MTDTLNPETNDQTARARALCDEQIAMLGDLAGIGLRLARTTERQAESGELDAPAAALAYGRVARAVRQSLMLQTRVLKDLRDFERNGASLAAASAGHGKARVVRIIERIAEGESEDRDEIEALGQEALERLEDEDIYGDVLSKPVSEVVAMICQDLDLSPDWPRLAQEAWAREEMGGEAVGWPLAKAAFHADGDRAGLNLNPSPLGKGDREAGDGAFPDMTAEADVPLHHAAHGPPPPMGKDLRVQYGSFP